MLVTEPGILRCKDEISAEHQFKTPGRRQTLHGGDNRQRTGLQRKQRAVPDIHQRTDLGFATADRFNLVAVCARAEILALSPDENGTHFVVVLKVFAGGGDQCPGMSGEAVEFVGAR